LIVFAPFVLAGVAGSSGASSSTPASTPTVTPSPSPSSHGGNFGAAGALNGKHTFSSPRFRQALTKFAACLRQNGVNLPAPNTSGKGPVFPTKGINPSSPQFKAAEIKCRSVLRAGLESRPGPGAAAAG
jgi:hypothetical protein